MSDGVIELDYGDPVSDDPESDVLDGLTALDLLSLYGMSDDETFFVATTVAGDVYSAEGNFLYYFDTTHDVQGANVDVGRRPITVADPFKPEFRLDISMIEGQGSVQLNAWANGEWETRTFTGSIAILAGDPSVIEIQVPRFLFGDSQQLHVGVLSTDRPRAHTAADILGTDFTPANWSEALVMDVFFALPVTE